ncbi:MAG TPA: hypothetical protein VKK79_13465 [Candidatus Lokiarchaeia archaeon]|nr:hypothetical protein [Candidatus Lokiarchaeia archaeon]
MVELIEVEKVEFPLKEASNVFWVTFVTAEDLLKAAELEGVPVVYQCDNRMYFTKGSFGGKYLASVNE